jgi:BlaI family transcriptional regulator, penicillinase repressor
MDGRLSGTELQVMEEFWKHGRLSIREVQESFPKRGRPPYTSVQTTVYRLEEKGAVRRVRKIGNAHIFEAAVTREEARGSFIDDLVALVGGRPQTVMAHLVESGKLTREDIRDAEKLIDVMEKQEMEKQKE